MNIEEIKAREQAATSWLKKVHGCLSATAWKEISESVSDISTLLAEVERLTEENEQDKKLIESYKNSNLEQATEAAHLRKHLSRLDWMKAIDIAVQARERTEKSEYSDNDY